MMEQGDIQILVFLGLTGVAIFYWDIRYLKLPDWLTWGSWGSGAFLALQSGPGPFGSFLGGSLGAFLFFLMVYHLIPGGIGGGDVKLAGFTGGFNGVGGWYLACHVSLFLALLFLIIFPSFRAKVRIPFGPFLWAGAVIVRLIFPGSTG